MRKFFLFFAVFIFIFSSVFCFALETVDDIHTKHFTNKPVKYSLTQVVNLATSNNSLIKAAMKSLKAVQEEKTESFTDFLPKFSAEYGYMGFKDDPVFKGFGGPGNEIISSHQELYHWNITVLQPLFTGFALTNKHKKADLDIKLEKIKKEKVIIDIIKEAKVAYFNLLLTQKIASVTKETVESLISHKNNAEKFYNQGIIPYNDLLRAEVALANVIQNNEKAAASVKIAESALNILIDKNFNSNTDVYDIDQIPPFNTALKILIKQAMDNRPELKEIDILIKQLACGIKMAESQYYPQVGLMAQYREEGDSPAVDSNEHTNRFNTILTVNAKWTFFEWGKTKASVAKIKYEKQKIIEQLRDIKNKIKLETKSTYLTLNVAKKNIKTAKRSLSQAQENWRITNVQYKQQVATSTEVLDARTFLTGAETNYYKALYGYMISLAKLNRSIGSR